MSVRNTVKSIQDIMRKDAGVDGDAQRIGQLCWMFFLKIIDDQDRELEILNKDYRSPIPKRPATPATPAGSRLRPRSTRARTAPSSNTSCPRGAAV